MPSQQNENRRLFDLTVAFTDIPASIFARRVEIQETVSAPVGLLVKFPDGNGGFGPAIPYPVAFQPVVLGDTVSHGNALGEILGWPVQTGGNARAADIFCQVAAATGTSSILVTEIS